MAARDSVRNALFFYCLGLISAASAERLQYLYTVLTAGTDVHRFTAVALLDEEQFITYDHKSDKINLTMACRKITNKKLWKSQRSWIHGQAEDLKPFLSEVMKDFNHTKGVHTLQRIFGCEQDHNNVTMYDKLCYDGEHAITLDLKNLTWTAAGYETQRLKTIWEATGHRALDHKHDLESKCTTLLIQYHSGCNKSLERKVRPEASVFQKHSSSPEVVCHATGFFPKALNITWQKDGEDVHEDVELRETLPNHNGTFQKRSILKVPAEELQKHTYTCVIQHSSLEKELVLPVSERRILRGGGSDGGSDGGLMGIIIGVVVTLVAVVAGIVIWKKNAVFQSLPRLTLRSGMSSVINGNIHGFRV